jgi:tRNA-splicing ligase RtcB
MPAVRIFGEHDERTRAQMARCMEHGSALGGVLCADGHLGYAQPVGGVIAYAEHISVSGVGFDIACGNMAVKLDLPRSAIADRIGPLLRNIAATVSFGLGRCNAEKVEHPVLDSPLWQEAPSIAHLKAMARDQLGTVGSGNHYVDLFEDEQGLVWIGVHFGSRGLGHKTATAFVKAAGGKDGIDVAPTLLHQDSDLGRQYLAAMTLAGQYAYAGREWVIERVSATAAAISGWCARARPRRSRASAASSAARWAMTPSSSPASTARLRRRASIRLCTAPAA